MFAGENEAHPLRAPTSSASLDGHVPLRVSMRSGRVSAHDQHRLIGRVARVRRLQLGVRHRRAADRKCALCRLHSVVRAATLGCARRLITPGRLEVKRKVR